MTAPRPLTFDEWLELGRQLGHAGPGWCDTHEPGAGLTPAEHERFERGLDPCVPVVRCYPSGVDTG